MPQRTEIIRIDAEQPEPEMIRRAAAVLCAGGLVVFPTETVYGLGANALSADAVQSIFMAKGRPANNPLIVHVADLTAARQLTTSWPRSAQVLAEQFWPGPLSLVLPKTRSVPDVVTAGAATVALRVPAHPVALALLRSAGLPVAAPSANRSNRVSPTRAEHVLKGLEGRVDLLLDAGPTCGGLESTVVDLTSHPPRLLRPGLVTQSQIESAIGPITQQVVAQTAAVPLPSPGMLSRHYAPRATLECIAGSGLQRVRELLEEGISTGWMTRSDEQVPDDVLCIRMPHDPGAYSTQLYATLHALDDAGVQHIIVELPPQTEAWQAVHDRLRRASR